jgi:hypothetical protein
MDDDVVQVVVDHVGGRIRIWTELGEHRFRDVGPRPPGAAASDLLGLGVRLGDDDEARHGRVTRAGLVAGLL